MPSQQSKTKTIKRLRSGGPQTFRSFAEFRAHFFPEQHRKEQRQSEVDEILGREGITSRELADKMGRVGRKG